MALTVHLNMSFAVTREDVHTFMEGLRTELGAALDVSLSATWSVAEARGMPRSLNLPFRMALRASAVGNWQAAAEE